MLPSLKVIEKVGQLLQSKMRIMDWEIVYRIWDSRQMELTGGNSDSLATASRQIGLKHCAITFNENARWKTQCWYNTLVHELNHVMTTDLVHHARRAIDLIENEKAREFAEDLLDTYYESYTEIFATVFIKLYPKEQALKDAGCREDD